MVRSGDEESQVSIVELQRGPRIGPQKLRRRTFERIAAAPKSQEAGRAERLRRHLDLIHLLPAEGPAARCANSPDPPSRLDSLAGNAEIASAKHIRRVEDLEPKAQIRLVAAVPLHRLSVGKPGQRRGDRLPRLTPESGDETLAEAEHILDADERGLHIDLGKLRLPVGPQVLIPKAARDLNVAVKTGHHQQLLIELRRLRQGVEFAGLYPARYQIIAGAFGSGFGQD